MLPSSASDLPSDWQSQSDFHIAPITMPIDRDAHAIRIVIVISVSVSDIHTACHSAGYVAPMYTQLGCRELSWQITKSRFGRNAVSRLPRVAQIPWFSLSLQATGRQIMHLTRPRLSAIGNPHTLVMTSRSQFCFRCLVLFLPARKRIWLWPCAQVYCEGVPALALSRCSLRKPINFAGTTSRPTGIVWSLWWIASRWRGQFTCGGCLMDCLSWLTTESHGWGRKTTYP